jgi:hypothetical protein
VPSGLQGSVGTASATFKWSASTDTQGGSISYNLRVGTTHNGSEILSPMADVNTGMLLTPGMGNVQLNRSWTLNLPPGTYYWSVQSVDGSYASSNFAAEQQLVVDYPATTGIANQTLVYGDSKSLDLSSSFTSSSAITYSVTIDNNTNASATLQGATLNIAGLHVGTATVTVTAAVASGGKNTSLFLVTVNKAPLQVTADDISMAYRGSAVYTYKVTGLKLTDTESVITPLPTVTGPDINTSVPGTYPLVVHVGTAVNYTIIITNGTLTITKAVGQVTLSNLNKEFNNLPQSPTVTVVPANLKVDVTYDGSSTAPSAVGSYHVVATINDADYQGTATGTMVIAAITAVEDLSKTVSMYPNPVKDELFIKASGLENGRVSITNVLGEQIGSQNLENEQATIDCRSFAAGMMIVIIYDESNNKIVITRAIKM